MRKLQEYIHTGKWSYVDPTKRAERIGTLEEALGGTDVETNNIAARD